MDVERGEIATNLAACEQFVRDPRLDEAQVVVFPECALTGYCFDSKSQALEVAEPITGSAVARMGELAADSKKHLVFGMLERSGDQLFNACVVVGPEGLLGVYRKSHLPFLGVDRFATPGDQPPLVVDLKFLRLGVHICYDASFPEATRSLMLQSADLVVLPTNWPNDALAFSQHLGPVRAMENHLYFMIVNRIGSEGGFDFIGGSSLSSPHGQILKSCSAGVEDVLCCTIDPAIARRKHIVRVAGQHEIDRLADRRPDLYTSLSATSVRPTTRSPKEES